jgi:predicted secreted protein
VLPFGVRGQHEGEDMAAGTDPGAPIVAQMGRKLLYTTLISTALFACLFYAYYAGFFSIDRVSRAVGIPY